MAIYLETIFDPQLIKRFDISGPRYTSYPTADRFSADFKAQDLRLEFKKQLSQREQPLSLYIHIPFCSTICYYCACNKIITKDHSRAEKYLSYLHKELVLLSEYLPKNRLISQLHFGGGTPTFLSAKQMTHLFDILRRYFSFASDGEYSIEIDPRKVGKETVQLLAELGFNRISVGVQDFDEHVQQAVNRIQPLAETMSVIDYARQFGFKSVSVDLIYGLPKQTMEGFNRTLDHILNIAPDRLSLYSYAHLPKLFMPQRRILQEDLPEPEQKMQILQLSIQRLRQAGYVYIGMDHFAKPDDELSIAQQQGKLQRNFQGYSTQAECDLVALGVSAISKVGSVYSQNVKTIDEYYQLLDQNCLPILRGIQLTKDDQLRHHIIQTLMCQFELKIAEISAQYGIEFEQYFKAELEDLETMAQAGLLDMDKAVIRVRPKGRMLVRVIAMVFDHHLRQDKTNTRYSKVI